MTRSARLSVAAAALLLFWAGVAYQVAQPTTPQDYRRTLVQVAQATHDAAGTGALVARQQTAGQVFPTFAATAYDDAAAALAGAAHKLAAEPPPDPASTAMRDRLAPLLRDTVKDLGDATTAAGDDERRAAAGRLERSAEELSGLLEEWGAA
ncbi:hypothetical protein AB0368_29010 [Actinoplanes sp. NPDC051475]|uniref:hypothetical protein n=1 Tax=Actinoplanes sp. NPDC051475 TaxID=3157225 RepID=UPI003450D2F7